jgi:hypothetical protein
MRLESPAAGICRDGDELIVLESSGARLVRFSAALAPLETIPLSRRVVGPRGVAADRFYYYVYDHEYLYRMPRTTETLVVWLGNVEVAGLAGYSPGEMLVSDAVRGSIWYKTVFGESRKFIDARDVSRPGAMVPLPGQTFGVISKGQGLVVFNRAGIIVRYMPIEAGCDLLAADSKGTICAGKTGVPIVSVFGQKLLSTRGLPKSCSPAGIVLFEDRLVVLDAASRVLTFALPE